ncbi:hypothetical protein C8P66_11210 [Humitalea rosea]|uniref:Uncharacterized protein n=1 Tax=Humitalea rosea TaxID=990373 RepID=A0A2W7IE22_9PROT|nr:hypothetical protein [Humitalea rosea]PZW44995.1 hypothetical protein C8P66_11210 [Humitalea rosea]
MSHPARRLPPWLFLAVALLLPALALAQPASRAVGEREAVIANETGLGIRELYVRPANGADPGPERLSNEVVLPGTSFRARLGRQANCSFDIRAVFMDNSVVERRAVDLCRNSRVIYGDPSAPLREAMITNFTDLSIQYLYAAPPGAADRGPDRLGNEVIGAGDSFRMRLGRRRDCIFDMVAVFEDETEEQRDRQDLCRSQRVSFGDPSVPLREVTISNEGQAAIQRLFASPPEAGQPGPDRLVEGELAPGDSYRIRIRGRACVVDIRAEYDGYDAETQTAVDICAISRVAFDGSLRPRREARPITLVNRHGATVREAYVSLTAAEDWGEDRLGETVLERGRRLPFTIAADCQVDIRVVFANGAAEERREVDICTNPVVVLRPGWTVAETLDADVAEPATAPPAPLPPPTPGSIRIRNQSSVPMVQLFTDAPGTPRGPDRLGATVLGAGETLDFHPPEGVGCLADLFAVFRDGQEVARPALDLCAGQEVSLP